MQNKQSLKQLLVPSPGLFVIDLLLGAILMFLSRRSLVVDKFQETFFAGGLDIRPAHTMSGGASRGIGLIFGERLGLAIVWVFIGLIACFLVWVVANTVIEFNNRKVVQQQYVGRIDDRSMLQEIFLRLAAAVGPWLWLIFGFGLFVPVVGRWFEHFVLHPTTFAGLLSIVAAWLLASFLVHVVWQLFRLMRNAF